MTTIRLFKVVRKTVGYTCMPVGIAFGIAGITYDIGAYVLFSLVLFWGGFATVFLWDFLN